MTCAELPTVIIDEIQHVGRQSEAKPKLLSKDAAVHYRQALGQCVAEIDIDDVGQCIGGDHRPQPLPQAATAHHHSTEDTAQGHTDHADRALDKAIFLRESPRPPLWPASMRKSAVTLLNRARGSGRA